MRIAATLNCGGGNLTQAMVQIEKVYTDGACSGNPGPGGWGVVFYLKDGQVHELGGFSPETTNNRMELQAAIAALQFLKDFPQEQSVALFTDSEYVKKGATQWISGWKRRGWKTAQGKAVQNQDLWVELDQADPTRVNWFYVKGHSGDPGNDRCDEIAREFSLNQRSRLTQSIEDVEPVTANKSVTANSKARKAKTESQRSTVVNSEKPKKSVETVDVNETLEANGTSDRLQRLQDLADILQIAQQLSQAGYWITSDELADLLNIQIQDLRGRGKQWHWRNWIISQVQSEGDEMLWRLHRDDTF